VPATADAATAFGIAVSTTVDFAVQANPTAVPLDPATSPTGQPLPVNPDCP
jgi:hypothetical protein